ncbi:uncharacterized protein LOC115451004 [Manduca sexta]|uniref:Uncharacterized protein n=1 Tax=Manduca sexta TaxID=7130 RepID=A0A922CVY3_MANSE|nr:uncharacterized protein LOC115451004 [Manduca sexta]KAG6461540.1 hypothetical protein O3G_MSEX012697 [Manduca sexta]
MCDCAAEVDKRKKEKSTQATSPSAPSRSSFSSIFDGIVSWLPLVGGTALAMALLALLYKIGGSSLSRAKKFKSSICATRAGTSGAKANEKKKKWPVHERKKDICEC